MFQNLSSQNEFKGFPESVLDTASRLKGGIDELGSRAVGDHADVGGDLIKIKE